MKLLLYCTKGKPYLIQGFARPMHTLDIHDPYNFKWCLIDYKSQNALNGKIVVECDYEVEEFVNPYFPKGTFVTHSLTYEEFLKQSCLNENELNKYINNGKRGYAIHIKNLHIFDEPMTLNRLDKRKWIKNEDMYSNEGCDSCINGVCKNCPGHYEWFSVSKAPQNMMIVWDNGVKKVLISIHPKWLAEILNGKKTIEVRKKVLKGMLENGNYKKNNN